MLGYNDMHATASKLVFDLPFLLNLSGVLFIPSDHDGAEFVYKIGSKDSGNLVSRGEGYRRGR